MNLCPACDADMADDAHWHDMFECWVCDDCCPCTIHDDGESEPDDSGRDSAPGELGTAHAALLAAVGPRGQVIR